MKNKIIICILYVISNWGCISQKTNFVSTIYQERYVISGYPRYMENHKETDTIKINYHLRDSNFFEDFSLSLMREIYFYDRVKRKRLLDSILIDTVLKSNDTIYFINNGIKKRLAYVTKDSIELEEVSIFCSQKIFNYTLIPYKRKISSSEEIKFDVKSGWDNPEATWCRYIIFDKNFRAIKAALCHTGLGGVFEMRIVE